MDYEAKFYGVKPSPQTGKDYLAFRLMSHNRITPKGTFHFETLSRGIFCGQQVGTKFKSLPLDAAYHWSTCVRHHPAKDLTMCIKIKVVMEDGNSPFNGRDVASRGHFFSMLVH